VETKLARIAQVARQKPEERFTSLVHLINPETLKRAHEELSGRKVPGVDAVTKQEYGTNLDANVQDLVGRMKRQAYKPQPVKRVYIPKANGGKRPLGIPSYEDKLVQKAMAPILNAIYEADFLGCSFGYRPGRGCHDALKVLGHIIETRRVNYVLEADIRSFFDRVDHGWMMKFLEHRIADRNLLRLIYRFLRAGIMEAGIRYDTPEGTPQGGVISPILANIYLHYVLDLWFDKVYRKQCKGEAYLVRYADDFVICFQYLEDAKACHRALKERLDKFGLELAPEKTRIITFGRFAREDSRKRGGKKPDTFDFLGFTHYCGLSRNGKFRVKRKTSRLKVKASLRRLRDWLWRNLTTPFKELRTLLQQKLRGYYRYYGITDNSHAISCYGDKVKKLLYKWFNRRSQRNAFNWEKFNLFLVRNPLPRPKVYVSVYDINPEMLAYLGKRRARGAVCVNSASTVL